MKTSEMCRAAAERALKIGVCIDIILAVQDRYGRGGRQPEDVRARKSALLQRIDGSLGRHAYVTQWLHAKHKVPKEQLSTKPSSPNWHIHPTPEVQDYRRRWLLALAAEYEARGD